MEKTNSWRTIPDVNIILMCLLDKPLTYSQFPIKKSNWTRKENRKDNHLVRLEKEWRYIITERSDDLREKKYLLKEEKYLKEVLRSILKSLSKHEYNTNKRLIGSKELQEFIKRYIIRYKELMIRRDKKSLPSFNQTIRQIRESLAYTDKKLYGKYIKEKKKDVDLFIALCSFYNMNTEIETVTYTILDLYGNRLDEDNYNKRRKFKTILN